MALVVAALGTAKPIHLPLVRTSPAGESLLNVDLIDYKDLAYAVEVTVGTPP